MAETFVLDMDSNPHPVMLASAIQARLAGGDFWCGYLKAMVDATGSTVSELNAWLDRHS